MKKDKSIINEDWDKIFNEFCENNFSNHAFPLYLFTSRLYNELKEKKCKNILFMSREGQFLKKLFEKYIDIKKQLKQDVINIKTHYFLGSRNSIMAASLKPLAEENFEYLLRFFKYFIKPKMFLYSIGFTSEQIKEVEKTFGKKINKLCFNFKASRTFKKLKEDETFKKIYEENRTKQSTAFKEYMNTFKIDYEKEGLTFVDIGYHGTMQDLIYKYFDNKVEMCGYFIKSRAKEHKHNIKIGLLGDKLNKKLIGSKVNQYDTFNYEQILRADHGRCLGYEFTTNNKVQAVLDGEFKDLEIFNKYVKNMQDQIFEKFEMIAQKALSENADITDICTIYFYYTVKNKTKNDYQWILDMQDCHHDDFGYVGYPGKAFARGLRKFAFTLKDKIFVCNKKGYVKKLKKNLKLN